MPGAETQRERDIEREGKDVETRVPGYKEIRMFLKADEEED